MTDNEKKLLQAKHRLEEAQARNRVKERKARTRRLIQEGLNHTAPTNATDVLLQLLQGIQPKAEPDVEVSQQETDDMALDFVDGF